MIDEKKFNEVRTTVDEDVSYLDTIIDEVVNKYTSSLDTLMENINKEIIEDDHPAINTIEKYFMSLTSALYSMADKVEKLGVYDSISKSKFSETYNMKYLEHQHSNDDDPKGKKPTVAESTAVSENAAIYDKTINDMYNKSYKIIKAKIDAANNMVNTLSKVMSHRMQEAQMIEPTSVTIKTEPMTQSRTVLLENED